MDFIATANHPHCKLNYSGKMKFNGVFVRFGKLAILKKAYFGIIRFFKTKNKSERLGFKKFIDSEFINKLTYRKWGIWYLTNCVNKTLLGFLIGALCAKELSIFTSLGQFPC
jgi:hypothetical protein